MENKLKQVIRKTAYLKEWLCIEQAMQFYSNSGNSC